jgi:hypothetical protein
MLPKIIITSNQMEENGNVFYELHEKWMEISDI